MEQQHAKQKHHDYKTCLWGGPTMKVRLWMPRQIDCKARFLTEIAGSSSLRRRHPLEIEDRLSRMKDGQQPVANEDRNVFLTLRVQPSRVLWNSLRPLLFETSESISRRALFCILSACFQYEYIAASTTDAAANQTISVDHRSMSELFDIQQRVVNRIHRPKNHFFQFRGAPGNGDKKSPACIVLWIQPPHTIQLEYLFSSLLIRWEHRLIQAQSMAGYMATLGGGFFLCHHFATALFLANQQQRLAVLLNDETMYYSCAIHKAYSCIYSGRFRLAWRLLRQVQRIVTGTSRHQSNEVIERMCRSALLFGKRMRRQAKLLTTLSSSQQTRTTATSIKANSTESVRGLVSELGCSSTVTVNKNSNPSKQLQPPPVDDFVRVRVVRDKSRKDDLVIPFSKARGG